MSGVAAGTSIAGGSGSSSVSSSASGNNVGGAASTTPKSLSGLGNAVTPVEPSPEKKAADEKAIGRTRRRLTLAGANVLLDGVGSLALQSPNTVGTGGTAAAVPLHGDEAGSSPAKIGHVFGSRFGLCNKGYAPYNPAKKNQDSMILCEDPKTGALFVGVLDGHGEVGHLVSQFFRDRLPKRLFSHPKFPANCGEAMAACIASIEVDMLADPAINSRFSGSTCVLATIVGNQLTCANIGDSRIILGRRVAGGEAGEIVPTEISRDHKPDLPDEKARIEAKGGRVFAIKYDDGIDGPPRVWLGNMDVPGLAMSRSLGDTVGHDAGIISTPEITSHIVTSEHDILIIASDGLWEFIENDECLKLAYSAECAGDPKAVCRFLAAESQKRWMREEGVVDDTTIIVAYVDRTRL